ncbi:MAG: ShlB/FhaC/HecB family hemolysin secretion/activation protein, partial [Gloeomargaritaceae cyanobacterium C42_A2020_066]|nr:ShlB/FhaC/HecB family hemolysin secretion/activation protein [Gloeomargaritaceae cyanobacterium C42_A2020_066]
MAVPSTAEAQTPRIPGIIPEPRPPEITPAFPSPTDFLPIPEPRPTLPRVPDLPSGEGVTVQQFQVVGNTVFGQRDFADLTDPYLSKTLNLAELQQIADAITQLYVTKGYITSGAFI